MARVSATILASKHSVGVVCPFVKVILSKSFIHKAYYAHFTNLFLWERWVKWG